MATHLPPLIELESAPVTRGGRIVLHDVNFHIDVGKHVAILRTSGKSTLVKTLMRECYPLARAGSCVRLSGREVWNVFELRSLPGIVAPGSPAPARHVSGLEMVLLRSGGADGPENEVLSQGPIEKLFGVRLNLTERGGYIHAW